MVICRRLILIRGFMELGILEWINANLHGCNFINHLIKFITYLGEDGIAWALVGVVLLFFKKTRKSGLIVLAGFASVVVVNHFILKNIINRPRPFTESQDLVNFIKSIGMQLPTSSSFPSGHTTISITSAVILTMCFGKRGAWSFIPAVLISLSRIFLCVHYPTDVLGGAVEGIILGVLVVLVGRVILDRLERWWINRKEKKQNLVNASENNNTIQEDKSSNEENSEKSQKDSLTENGEK